jgi:hypothetical protein
MLENTLRRDRRRSGKCLEIAPLRNHIPPTSSETSTEAGANPRAHLGIRAATSTCWETFREAVSAVAGAFAWENDMAWTILWQTMPVTERWNTANAETEAGALDRAKHFLKLGFPVYAIRAADGSLYMDEEQLSARFGAPRGAPDRPRPVERAAAIVDAADVAETEAVT